MRFRQAALIIKAQSDGQGQVPGGFELIVDPGSDILLVLHGEEGRDIKIGVIYLPEQEGGSRISGCGLLDSGGVPVCGFRIAETIAARVIWVPLDRKLVVPVFESSFDGVLAFDPRNVVKELPAVRDATLGIGVGFPILRIGNIGIIQVNIGRATRISDGADKS